MFFLAREVKKKLPTGTKPYAVVQAPAKSSLKDAFLCADDDEYKREQDNKKFTAGTKRGRDSSASASGGGVATDDLAGAGIVHGSVKHARTAHLDDELKRFPLAASVAEAYHASDAPPAEEDKKKKKRGTGAGEGADDESDSDSDDEDVRHRRLQNATTRGPKVVLPLHAKFDPLPYVPVGDKDYRSAVYVPGPPGCGKSTFCASMIRNWKNSHPDPRNPKQSLPVYGFCQAKLTKDPIYTGLGIKQLPVDFLRQILSSDNGEVDLEKAFGDTGCLVLFDDWDSFEKADRDVVQAALSIIINVGRKPKVSVLVTSHELTNYGQTRAIIGGADFVVVFPKDTQYQKLEYLCHKCIGLPLTLVKRLKAKEGKWVMVHNRQPTFVLSEREAEMI